MSEYDDIRKDRREPAPEADVHVARWSPWIWIIPTLAVFFVGYLIVRYGFFGGGDVTVRFAEARGLDRYSPVRFRGAKVGTVQKITIDEKTNTVVVRISMDASMNYALREGTRFWISEPGLEGGGIGSILSGTYVGIEPGPGEETREFTGAEEAPVLAPPGKGKTIILESSNVGAVAAGTPVQFQGVNVGRVLGSQYNPGRMLTSVHVFIDHRFADHVRQSSRFWRGGGISVSLSGGGASLSGASLASLMSSPISFYTPEVLAGAPVASGTRFELHPSQNIAVASADGPHLTYLTYFPGSLRGLRAGTPVQMRGVQVGLVREVRLRYVPQSATLITPVLFEIDPRTMEFPIDATTTRESLRADLNDALAKLVQKGLRASLATSLVLPGASAINLDIVAKPGTGRLVVTNDPPLIPAAEAGTGIEGAMAALNDLGARVRGIPIEEISGNLRNASRRMNRLMSDPILDESLQRLDRSLTQVEEVTRVARENVGPIAGSLRNAASSAESAARTADTAITTASQNVAPIVESLRNAASSAEAAAGRAEQLMGTSARQNYDLGELIKELTRAAEAVRGLADYLNENPDALLKGRGK